MRTEPPEVPHSSMIRVGFFWSVCRTANRIGCAFSLSCEKQSTEAFSTGSPLRPFGRRTKMKTFVAALNSWPCPGFLCPGFRRKQCGSLCRRYD